MTRNLKLTDAQLAFAAGQLALEEMLLSTNGTLPAFMKQRNEHLDRFENIIGGMGDAEERIAAWQQGFEHALIAEVRFQG